jgi:hypothetical protein
MVGFIAAFCLCRSTVSGARPKEKEQTMSKIEWKKWVGVVGRMLLAYAFIFSQSAWAGQDPKANDNPKPATKAAVQQIGEKPSSAVTVAKTQTQEGQAESLEKSSAEKKPTGDGKNEGIKVHGHWTIEVRNPDGTVVTHREFENSLVAGQGNSFLSQVLARQITVSHWQIGIGPIITNTVRGLCLDPGGTPSYCTIAEPEPNGACPSTNLGVTCPASNVFPTLSTPTLDANGNLVLSGQATAALNSSVGAVSTGVHSCNPTLSPASVPCPATVGQGFATITSATATVSPNFPASIPVQAGQTIAVTVVLSFS